MAIKPILFNTEMVRAILEGRKTQTRRVCKCQGECNPVQVGYHPPFHSGDILWVRERFCEPYVPGRFAYFADYDGNKGVTSPDGHLILSANMFRWKPSIHMPKQAARIFLRVNEVRVQKLNNILAHAGEVAKEGIPYSDEGDIEASGLRFKELWDSTIKPADRDCYGWYANPWVWVIEFERCEKPEGWCI